jgi:hypothetical protein
VKLDHFGEGGRRNSEGSAIAERLRNSDVEGSREPFGEDEG